MNYKALSNPEKWILKGIPILFIIGSLLHFMYDLSGNNFLVGLVTAVNESVWEHAKMVLLPVILWWSLYYLYNGKRYDIDRNQWYTGALIALLTSLLSIPMLYYFYTEAFGTELLIVDILILLLAITMGQLLGLHTYRHKISIPANLVIFIFMVLVVIFMWFTVYPPQIPWFVEG